MAEEEEKEKLRTLCDYLFQDRFFSTADFGRFEKCFKHLFINEQISLEKVFYYIVGVFKNTERKRKYITYTRLYNAYLNYKNKTNSNDIPKDATLFFEKLLNSTIKLVAKESDYIGQKNKIDSASQKFLDNKNFSLSKVIVLCNPQNNILGLKLEYNGQKDIEKMFGEENLTKALELKLDVEIQKNLLIKKEIRDSITHIYGTFNKTITSVGFKCASGKEVQFGKKDGNPFVFGAYGKKFQCLNLKIEPNGITGFEVYFKENQLKNKNITYKEDEPDAIYEENIMNKINDKDYNLFQRNQMKGLGNVDLEKNKFNDEDIFLKTPMTLVNPRKSKMNFINDLLNSSSINATVIANENKKYESYLNPFFPLYENPELMIPHPFFPEEPSNQNKKYKGYKAIIKNCFVPYFDNITNKTQRESLKKQLILTTIKEKKDKLQRDLVEIKNNLITNIYKKLLEKEKTEELDSDIKKALNIITRDDTEDLNKKKKIKNQDIIKEEQDEEDEDSSENRGDNNGEDIDEDKDKNIPKKENQKKEALKFLCDKLIKKDDNLKTEICNQLNRNESNNNQLESKISLDENKFELVQKKNNEIFQQKTSEEVNGKMLTLLNDIFAFKKKETIPQNQKEAENGTDLNEEEEEEEEEEKTDSDFTQSEPEEKKTNEESEERTKVIEEISQDKNDLKTRYGKEINEIELEIENQKKRQEKEEFEDFVIIDNEKTNILIKSFYNKKIDEKIKIFGGDELPKKLRPWKDVKFNMDNAIENKFKKRVIWRRPDETQEYYIFRKDPTKDNIKQSTKLRDCYFLSAIGSLCNKGQGNNNFIKKMFHSTEKTKEHVYGIYFYINGIRQLILIDDCLPYDKKYNSLFFSSSYNESELWVSLLEKAWAKFKGSYRNINDGHASEAFKALTGAYTEKIQINRWNRGLWDILEQSKDFPICAGTSDFLFGKGGLKPKHEYILVEVVKEGSDKKVVLRDPFGSVKTTKKDAMLETKRGILTISYDDFLSHFHLVEINYFKYFTEENIIKIENKETMRCQFIKITNEHDNNEAFINLYQNNDKNPVFSYLLLIKEKENPKTKGNTHIYRYNDSITSHKDTDHESHICLKVIPFEKGTYYLCCDINYRFLRGKDKNDISVQDYLIKIISKQKIEVKNVTENLRTNNKGIEIFKEAMVHLMINPGKLKITPIADNDNGVEVKLFKEKEKLPFDIFFFKSKEPETLKIQFEIEKNKSIYYLYNDNEFSELDKLSVKVIEGFKNTVIMVMNSDYSFDNNGKNKKYIKHQIKRDIDIEYEHPVFKKGKKIVIDLLKKKVKTFNMETKDKKGFVLGVESICDNELKLILKSDTLFVCNPQYWHYGDSTKFKFSLKKGEKKAICLRKMLGETEPKYKLIEDI